MRRVGFVFLVSLLLFPVFDSHSAVILLPVVHMVLVLVTAFLSVTNYSSLGFNLDGFGADDSKGDGEGQ